MAKGNAHDRAVRRSRLRQTTGGFLENALTNNIVLAQAMGLCPIIAAGTTLKNGVALTACTAAVLLPLTFIVSLLGKRVAKWARPALYVVMASLLLVGAAWLMGSKISPELYAKLYLFIPLIAVDLLYTRGLLFRSSVPPLETLADSLGSTVGFGLVICLISALREMAIAGTLWDRPLGFTVTLPEAGSPFAAFILLGFMAALLQWGIHRRAAGRRRKEEDR